MLRCGTQQRLSITLCVYVPHNHTKEEVKDLMRLETTKLSKEHRDQETDQPATKRQLETLEKLHTISEVSFSFSVVVCSATVYSQTSEFTKPIENFFGTEKVGAKDHAESLFPGSQAESEMVHSAMAEFLTRSFVQDYLWKRLSIEQAGWRGLLEIVASLRIPRSHVYGDNRYGHTFGKPLESLVRTGIVEYRRFPGKGRGGEVLKVRVLYERDTVRQIIRTLALQGHQEVP